MKADDLTIFNTFQRIGNAICRVNANNTHSGNISMRDPRDPDIFYITASGSQGGGLVQQDIVPVRFSGVSWGDARGSTESTIHRKVLALPGSNAAIHAHYLHSTFISFDSRERQLFLRFIELDSRGREAFLFQPIDLFGAYVVGGVSVARFDQPVGSPEMEERIPGFLKDTCVTIVQGHGPFARGASPGDAFYRLSVLEGSSRLVISLRRNGIDIGEIQNRIISRGRDAVFPAAPHLLDDCDPGMREVSDPSLEADFRQRLNYNYNNSIGSYGTGSMSQKISADAMIYCPLSAVPEDFQFPLFCKKIEFHEDDPLDMRIHKLIFQHTHQNSCMITTSPLATAEGMAILAKRYGIGVLMGEPADIPYTDDNHPVVMPIDAEAIYLNPKIGLVDMSRLADMTPDNPILNMLRWYKGCCIVAGYGVISTGQTTLEQAAHNAASAERIAQFRSEVSINEQLLNGPAVEQFEPGSE